MNIRKKLKLQRNMKWIVVAASTAYMVYGITNITKTNSLNAEPETTTGEVQMTESPTPTQADIIIEMREGQYTEQGTELVYPFNTMSQDWSGEQIAGFKEYQIPEEYSRYGGYFPVEIQQFTYIICKQYKVDYSLILAMIETESSYHYDAVSSCNAVGYMQVVEIWHTDRMDKLGASDLENPYQNIMVGIDYMAELLGQYQTSVALSAYNRGFRNDKGTGALDLADRGIYQTEYSEKVLKRAAQIEMELSQ